MFMYNEEGQEAFVVPEQVEALTAAGWSKEPPAANKAKPVVDTEPESQADADATPKSGGKITLKRK